MRTTLPLAAFLFLTQLSAPVHGEDSQPRRYGRHFNGAFVEVAARGARAHVTSADYNGWSWDVGLRQAFVAHLLDTRFSYSEDRFGPRSDSATGDFVARSLMVHGAFHPAYLALLLSNWAGYVLASFYVEAGIGAQVARSGPVQQTDLGARFSLGAGLDVPLTDPDHGWSFWLNGLWRYTWADFDLDGGGEVNLHHHALWGGLALRFNGMLF